MKKYASSVTSIHKTLTSKLFHHLMIPSYGFATLAVVIVLAVGLLGGAGYIAYDSLSENSQTVAENTDDSESGTDNVNDKDSPEAGTDNVDDEDDPEADTGFHERDHERNNVATMAASELETYAANNMGAYPENLDLVLESIAAHETMSQDIHERYQQVRSCSDPVDETTFELIYQRVDERQYELSVCLEEEGEKQIRY